MKYWFIVHDLMAYSQHPDLIGKEVKTPGIPKPKFLKFQDISNGDRLVYYAVKDYVVTGVFEVISDMEYIDDDESWGEVVVYRINPLILPPPGFYLDFKKFLFSPWVKLDMIPEKKNWGRYIHGKTCVEISQRDFSQIQLAVQNQKFHKSTDDVKISLTRWQKKYGKPPSDVKISKSNRHQMAIEKWKEAEEGKFGFFKPEIKITNVNLNDVLPNSIWLKEQKKYVDGLAKLEIGGQPIYQSILEVQSKGSKEDLCVRVSIILPFVTRVDVVSDEKSLQKIIELLERIADPNIVKSRVKFYSFKEFLK